MTIGPEPRIMIRRRSSRRGTDGLQEAVEEIQRVVRARAGLRVVLDGAARDVKQRESLDGAVVEVHVAEARLAEVGVPADRLVGLDALLAVWAEHREAVVL